jgi:peptidyl-prolyl cis-trans isomerase A (cyclophilin A)
MIQEKRQESGCIVPCRLLQMLSVLSVLAIVLAPMACRAGTIVHFDTTVADFDVELFDSTMPITVTNFLSYVNAGSYSSSLIHRSTTYNPGSIQIVQGGGYQLLGNTLLSLAANPPIVLESGAASNDRGTIAMARGAATDSATSQYFFNIQSNPALDGNYAVFGRVLGADGLAALDAIGAVPVYDASPQFGAAFAELPLVAPSLDAATLVLVNDVTVLPASAVPEPSTYAMIGAGALGLLALRRRQA